MRDAAPIAPVLRRVEVVFSFVAVASVTVGLGCWLVHFGLSFDAAGMSLQGNIALNILASLLLAGLLMSNFFVCRHFQQIFTYFKTFGTVFLRFLLSVVSPTPVLCSTPRTVHGSRAPPAID